MTATEDLVRDARLLERLALGAALDAPGPAARGLGDEFTRGLDAGWRDGLRFVARRLRKRAGVLEDEAALDEWWSDLGIRGEDEV